MVLHGLGTKPAGVLLFRMRSPKTFFLGFAVPSVTFSTLCYLSVFIVRFVGDVSRVFLATVLHGLGTKPAGVLLFRMRSPKTFFLGFAWLPAGFPSFCFFLVGSKGNVLAIFLAAASQWLRDKTCWGSAFRCAKHFSSIFAGVRVWRRFESFAGHGFAWLRHETCWGSSVSDAVLSGGLLFLISLVRSVGDVSRVFLSDSISLSHYLIISAFRR